MRSSDRITGTSLRSVSVLIWAGDQSWIESNGHLRSTIMTLDDPQACLIRKNAQASRAGDVHRGLLAGHPLARAPPRPNQRRRKTQPTLAQKSGRYRQGGKTPLPSSRPRRPSPFFAKGWRPSWRVTGRPSRTRPRLGLPRGWSFDVWRGSA